MIERFKREFNKTYLILSSEGSLYEESYEIPMILNNEPEKILPLHVLRIDDHIELFYEVSSKQTLKECAARRKLSAETVRRLFEALAQLLREVKNYMLDMDGIVLDLEHIYIREGTFYFCYCPWEKREVISSFRKMLEELLSNLDYHDTEGVALAYHLYQSACKGDFCIAAILEEHCKTEKNLEEGATDVRGAQWEKAEDPIFQREEEMQRAKKTGIIKRILKFFLKKEKQEEFLKSSGREGDEEPYREVQLPKISQREEPELFEGNTILLENMPAGQWRLRPMLPEYEEFCITGENFFVGKKKACVDGHICKDTVSRIHSRLSVRDGGLYIADINSTNGTFVNGESLLPGKNVEIFPGDRILFADVEYECYNSL